MQKHGFKVEKHTGKKSMCRWWCCWWNILQSIFLIYWEMNYRSFTTLWWDSHHIACFPLLEMKHRAPYYSKKCIITFNDSTVKKKGGVGGKQTTFSTQTQKLTSYHISKFTVILYSYLWIILPKGLCNKAKKEFREDVQRTADPHPHPAPTKVWWMQWFAKCGWGTASGQGLLGVTLIFIIKSRWHLALYSHYLFHLQMSCPEATRPAILITEWM